MSKTREERLAYMRGYILVKERHWRHVARLLDIARGYRNAMREPDRRCDACSHWTRGGPTCQWGYCDGEFQWGADAMFRRDRDEDKISTSADFYCANWRPA